MCKDCPCFRIKYEPLRCGGQLWDFGQAECKKHDLVVDFASHRKLNRLECVENDKANAICN